MPHQFRYGVALGFRVRTIVSIEHIAPIVGATIVYRIRTGSRLPRLFEVGTNLEHDRILACLSGVIGNIVIFENDRCRGCHAAGQGVLAIHLRSLPVVRSLLTPIGGLQQKATIGSDGASQVVFPFLTDRGRRFCLHLHQMGDLPLISLEPSCCVGRQAISDEAPTRGIAQHRMSPVFTTDDDKAVSVAHIKYIIIGLTRCRAKAIIRKGRCFVGQLQR